MEAELVALATASATAIVQQMATDGWIRARDRVVSFFANRGAASPSPEDIASDLDRSQAELTTAQQEDDEEAAADVRAEWRNRVRRSLRDDPEAASELRVLLDELNPGIPAQQVGEVHNTISGGTQHGPVVQTGTIGSLRFGTGGGE
ncbi:hypothetical protein ACIOJD_11670 [Streptomyces sp. NPDC088116]|uniref:hypothetical protein n=1 Tax=Streptomyces sp. NPDC088116 TaxID=3365825 RepID=UPI0037FAC46F